LHDKIVFSKVLKDVINSIYSMNKEVELQSFILKNGFIWGPEPEIYGGVSGFYTYGPLGKLLKNNVENELRKHLILNKFYEVECPTILPKIVWEASGHYNGFNDLIIKCSKCKKVFRPDKLIEENKGKPEGMTKKEMLEFIQEHKITCPSCKGRFQQRIEEATLMMKTIIGVDEEAYCRPETATTTYLPFQRYYDFFRKKTPMRVFQIGKAYRNEISPRQNVLRGREFTQAEAQIFLTQEEKIDFKEYEEVKDLKLPLWPYKQQKKGKPKKMSLKNALNKEYLRNKAYAWCLGITYTSLINLGIPENKIRFRQHYPKERAHYALDAWDVEVLTPTYGWIEVCGVHDRGDYDLTQHSKMSGKKLVFEGKKKPHVLEIAYGSDRIVLSLIDIFLEKEEERIVLRLPSHISPIKVSIMPLVRKDGLPQIAKNIYNDLRKEFIINYDETGSVGRMYRRMDEKGTPYCITIDYDTKKDNSVTIRERDSMKQVRIKIKDLKETLKKLINQEIEFKKAGKKFN